MLARVVESQELCKSISLMQNAGLHQLHLHKAISVVIMAYQHESEDREAGAAFGADQCVHRKSRDKLK